MRKILFLILLFAGVQLSAQVPSIEKLRALYKEAEQSQETTEKLVGLLDSVDREQPLLLAYKASGTMLMAKHVGNPFKKLSYFRDGKSMLEEAVDAAPESVQIRFLRFAIQESTPGFLGYKDKMEADKNFLLKEAPKLEDRELRHWILPFLRNSDYLTEEEKRRL